MYNVRHLSPFRFVAVSRRNPLLLDSEHLIAQHLFCKKWAAQLSEPKYLVEDGSKQGRPRLFELIQRYAGMQKSISERTTLKQTGRAAEDRTGSHSWQPSTEATIRTGSPIYDWKNVAVWQRMAKVHTSFTQVEVGLHILILEKTMVKLKGFFTQVKVKVSAVTGKK